MRATQELMEFLVPNCFFPAKKSRFDWILCVFVALKMVEKVCFLAKSDVKLLEFG